MPRASSSRRAPFGSVVLNIHRSLRHLASVFSAAARWRILFCPLFLLSLLPLVAAECAPPPASFPSGDASLTLQTADATLNFSHDPSLSSVTLTPPAEGLLIATFAYQDPPLTLTLALDAHSFAAGDTVSLPLSPPLTASDLLMTLDYAGATYSSAGASSGSLDIASLQVDDQSATAALSISFDVALVADTSASVSLSGFIEGAVN